MSASKRRRAAPADDPLRAKLDQLAERAIERVLAKGDDATLREITETLKTVSAYRETTLVDDGAPPPSAWGRYQRAMNGAGKPANGAGH